VHDMHERYQVSLDVPPVEAALWFASRYPEYFTSGEKGLDAWLDGLDPRDRDFVVAMGQTLTWAWIEHELAGFEARELEGLAREATVVVRSETLNQLELNVDHYPEVAGIEFDAYIGEPNFAAGVFARLVRGVSNCEGQNHLLVVLLDAALDPRVTELPEIDALMLGVPDGHELVRLRGSTLAQPVYVDAWSNLPPFTLDPDLPHAAPLLAELGQAPAPVLPGAEARPPYTAEIYAQADADEIELITGRDAPTKAVDLEIRAPKLDRESLARIEDPWTLYLYARILDVYDDPRAAELYGLVKTRECGEHAVPRTFLCAAATALLARLS
jgi:hypothetical protein